MPRSMHARNERCTVRGFGIRAWGLGFEFTVWRLGLGWSLNGFDMSHG